jgi:signal transduction histidine kinase
VASARLGLILLASGVVAVLALPVGAGAVSLPLPSTTPVIPTPPLPISTPPLAASPVPSPTINLTPTPTASTTPPASPSASGGGVAGGSSGSSGAPGSGSGTPAASTPAASTPAPTAEPVNRPDSVIHTVVGTLPAQVPVFPILLPLLAGLFLLLASAVLAAYRRTQEAHRFARLERTKSDFLKLASHELRTPLTVLLGYVSMIRDGDVKPGSAEFDRALPIIDDRLNQVNTIVEQMLEAARLEDGLDPLRLEEFDLADLAGDAVQAFRSRAGDSHAVGFRAPRTGLRVHLDRARVSSIIEQLLDNALKYSPDGGEIECVLARADGRALLTVRDSGLGIDPENLEKVFTRFGRLVTRDNSHIPGAGLGLFLARENARRMGGDITVRSRPAKGSAFTLELPLAPEPAANPAGARLPVVD